MRSGRAAAAPAPASRCSHRWAARAGVVRVGGGRPVPPRWPAAPGPARRSSCSAVASQLAWPPPRRRRRVAWPRRGRRCRRGTAHRHPPSRSPAASRRRAPWGYGAPASAGPPISITSSSWVHRRGRGGRGRPAPGTASGSVGDWGAGGSGTLVRATGAADGRNRGDRVRRRLGGSRAGRHGRWGSSTSGLAHPFGPDAWRGRASRPIQRASRTRRPRASAGFVGRDGHVVGVGARRGTRPASTRCRRPSALRPACGRGVAGVVVVVGDEHPGHLVAGEGLAVGRR